ncbi:hypothetical protein NECID01_1169 [Nematocida sp. AWRm77]|nr:hypothetical protein NECID01_1169 [Nematocida sp. AWRm77]
MSESSRIYPIYFNPRIKRSEGRKVPYRKEGSIPTGYQISKVLKELGVVHTLEKKEHPKHTRVLVSRFLGPAYKVDELERVYSTTGGSITLKGVANKNLLVKEVFNLLSK